MLPHALLVLATASWGVSFVVIKDAIAETPPVVFLFWRFALAAAVLVVYLGVRRRRPSRGAWAGGAMMGVLLAGGYALQTFGLRWTGVSNSGFLTGLYVVFTPLCAWLLWRQRVSLWTLACAATAAVGLALVAGRPTGDSRAGDLLTVACAVSFALHFLATERHAPRHDVAVLNAVQFLVATAIFGLGAAALGPALPSSATAGAIVYTALVCTVFGFGCQTWAQARMPATHAALAVSLEAPFAALSGALLLGERLGPTMLLGGTLMFAAFVGLATRSSAGPAVGVGSRQ